MIGRPTALLKDACEIIMGQAPKGTSYNYDGNGYPLIAGAADLGDLYPNPKKFTDKPTKISKVDDVVLCIRATIGDRNWSDREYCLGRGVAGLRPDESVLKSRYLWHWLGAVETLLKSKGRGATFLQVSKRDISELEIPLPPLPEQKRIAAILDAADELRKKRRESIELLDELVKSVFLDMFGDPVTNPKGWELKRLDQVSAKITDGTHHSPPVVDYGVPYITAKHLKKDGLRFCDSPWYVSNEDHEKIFARCNPEKGDVLYIKDGATTGLAAINRYDFPFSMLSSLALIKVVPEFILSEYLCAWLNNERSKIALKGHMGGAAIKRLTLTKIKRFEIPLPPIHIQEDFASISRAINSQRTLAKTHLTQLDNLFHSLQQRAFNGEL